MRRASRAIVAAGVLVAALASPATADHQAQHIEVTTPAVDRFFDDVPRLVDDEWGVAIGGFGGAGAEVAPTRAPVIFVHGNVVDHADWYPVREDFLAAGWTDQELWALSFNGLGNNSGSSPIRQNPGRDADHAGADNLPRGTNNDVNTPDLTAFIRMVQAYTGSDRVHLVGHSLGVTVIRRTMMLEPDIARDVVSVVAIAGANHGTSLCAPEVSRGTHMSCDEIDAGTDWLAELNGPDGARETYGPTAWLAVYDGTGAGDVAFVGPTYALSPGLLGADELLFPNVDHNGLRMGVDQVAAYRVWMEAADDAVGGAGTDPLPGVTEHDDGTVATVDADTDDTASAGGADSTVGSSTAPDESATSDTLPVTGGGTLALGLAFLLLSAVTRRRGVVAS